MTLRTRRIGWLVLLGISSAMTLGFAVLVALGYDEATGSLTAYTLIMLATLGGMRLERWAARRR